jgi:hypothetical protein
MVCELARLTGTRETIDNGKFTAASAPRVALSEILLSWYLVGYHCRGSIHLWNDWYVRRRDRLPIPFRRIQDDLEWRVGAISSSGEYRDVVQEVFFSLFGRGTGSTAEYRLEVAGCRSLISRPVLLLSLFNQTSSALLEARLLGSCVFWRESLERAAGRAAPVLAVQWQSSGRVAGE